MINLQWFEIRNDDAKWNALATWMRCAALAEDGTIYVPAFIGASETEVFLCASFDGVALIKNHKHIYAPLEWMAKEFPRCKDVCASIKRRLST
jgi:hypothetical protein